MTHQTGKEARCDSDLSRLMEMGFPVWLTAWTDELRWHAVRRDLPRGVAKGQVQSERPKHGNRGQEYPRK